jgi:allophanate hydrolase subunit 1
MEKYHCVLKTLPATAQRKEIVFRQAGDGFLQVEYGSVPAFDLLDSFRVNAVDVIVKRMAIAGLIETLPGVRTNLYHYDPLTVSREAIMDTVSEAEEQFKGIDRMVIDSRVIRLPIAFEDSETKKAVEQYDKQIRKDAPNNAGGYNFEYSAACNGCSVSDIKRMLLQTDWYNSGCGFWPGGAFFWPMDPRSKILVPKYNPPRLYTPEGAVGIGGVCLFTYTIPSGGGYQLFGRTIPVYQAAMRHPQFRESPFLYKPYGDRVQFFEVSEAELFDIYGHVQNNTGYVYDITEGQISVKEYVAFLNSDEVKIGAAALQKRQARAALTVSKL